MNNQRTVLTVAAFFVVALSLLSACGLTSRYRLDLFVAAEDIRKQVDVEQTQFVKNAALSDPYGDYKYVEGNGNVAVVTVGTRWTEQQIEEFRLLGFDEYWRCRLYLELSDPVTAGEIALKDKSFLQLMGKYDIDAGDKIFLPSDGFMTVDSVTSKSVFFSIEGKYLNRIDEPLDQLVGCFLLPSFERFLLFVG